FHPLLFGHSGGLSLFSDAGFAETEHGITTVFLFKTMLCRYTLDEIFDSAGRKFDRPAAIVTNEMQVIRLVDDGFIARHAMQLRLSYKAGSQENLDRTVNRCQTDPVAFGEEAVTNFFHRGVPFGFQDNTPDQRTLGGLL